MMTPEEQAACEIELISKINAMDYRELLTLWRFSKIGDVWFIGKVGEHFNGVFHFTEDQIPTPKRIRISKEVGFQKSVL
jgi:hypothetical protein